LELGYLRTYDMRHTLCRPKKAQRVKPCIMFALNSAAITSTYNAYNAQPSEGGSVAEWLACWTQAQKGPGSNSSRDAVG